MTARRLVSIDLPPRSTFLLCLPSHRRVTSLARPALKEPRSPNRCRPSSQSWRQWRWSTGRDFDWARPKAQADGQFPEISPSTMTAKESTARLEGELAALKARPWWRRLAGCGLRGSADPAAVPKIDRSHDGPQNPRTGDFLKRQKA